MTCKYISVSALYVCVYLILCFLCAGFTQGQLEGQDDGRRAGQGGWVPGALARDTPGATWGGDL